MVVTSQSNRSSISLSLVQLFPISNRIRAVNKEDEQIKYDDLIRLVQLIESSSQFREFHLKLGDIEIDLKRGGEAPAAASAAPAALPAPAPQQRSHHVGGGEVVLEPAAAPAPKAPPPAAAESFADGAIIVRSPMVGTFYRAPEPGARPFVEVGQKVEPDSVVCIIEVMKLMNSIPAGAAGVVTHVLIDDATPVEYGQALVVVQPQ